MKNSFNLKVDPVLSRKIVNQIQNHPVLILYSRSLIITKDLVGFRVKIYNGKEFALYTITPEMVGFKLGEFALTRAKFEFKKKKKKKKK